MRLEDQAFKQSFSRISMQYVLLSNPNNIRLFIRVKEGVIMSESKVYYTSMRTAPDDSIPAKLARLVKAAGLGGDIDVADKLVGIKAHFGE